MLALLFQKSSFSLSLLNDVINISTYFQLLLKELIFVSLFKVHNSGGVKTREKWCDVGIFSESTLDELKNIAKTRVRLFFPFKTYGK